MVYKKYIRRGGKLHGPYYYENKRVDGKVVTTYHGKSYPTKTISKKRGGIPVHYFIIGLLIFLIGFAIGINNLTGNAILDLTKSKYVPGEIIRGELEIVLREGEGLPVDSIVKISYDDMVREIRFSSLGDFDEQEGDFYILGLGLLGEGEVFGLKGEKEVDIDFELLVSVLDKDESSPESSPEGGSGVEEEADLEPEEEIEEDMETGEVEEPEEVVVEEVPVEKEKKEKKDKTEEKKPGASEEDSLVTGSAVSEENYIVYGTVRKGENFVYNLEGGSARILKSSIRIDGVKVDSDLVEIEIENGRVVVLTNYVEEGFGEDFLGSGEISFKINLEDFDLTAQEGAYELEMDLVYDNMIIVELDRNIAISESNETEVNVTVGNETIGNETIIVNNNTNVSLVVQVDTTLVGQIRLGENPKWRTNVKTTKAMKSLVIDLPLDVKNVQVVKRIIDERSFKEGEIPESVIVTITDINRDLEDIEVIGENFDVVGSSEDGLSEEVSEGAVEDSVFEETQSITITGEVSLLLDLKDPWIVEAFKWFGGLFMFNTGFVVQSNESNVTNDTSVQVEELVNGLVEVEIEYETEAPQAFEEDTANGKIVLISGPDTVSYENVIAFTEISDSLGARSDSMIKILHLETGNIISVMNSEDRTGTGYINYFEWIVPHLSNQTFIIEIIAAEHLDSNRTFVEDIFAEVSELDGLWSKTIPVNEYVRITFERELTSENDITVWPRTISGTPRIEIYEFNKSELIAEFTSLQDNEYNKVFLTGLQGAQDTFDLLILNGSIEFDHIIDPSTGFKFPTTQGSPSNDWIDGSGSLFSDDDGYVSADLAVVGDKIDSATYGFSVPGGATINGIEAKIGGLHVGTCTTGHFLNIDVQLSWNGGSSYTTASSSYRTAFNCGDSEASNTVGSSVDEWGHSWTLDEFSNTNFRARLNVFSKDVLTDQIDMDYIQINVHYTSDTTNPVTTLDHPSDSLTITNETTWYRATFTDNNGLANSTLFIWNSTDSLVYNKTDTGLTGTSDSTNFSFSLPYAGDFKWNYIVRDEANRFDWASNRTITFDVPDSVNPGVTINLPTNITYASPDLPLSFNVTLSENGTVVYSLDDGLNNVSMLGDQDPFGTDFNYTNSSIADGSYVFQVYANDTTGNNNNSESVTFSFDGTPPAVTINFPASSGIYSSSDLPLSFNVTLSENGTVVYSLDDGVNNVSMTGDQDPFGIDFTGSNSSIADGSYVFQVYANDTLGNNNFTESVSFIYDNTAPTISFVDPTPADSSSQTNTDIFVNLSTSDATIKDHYAFTDFSSDLVLWMRMDDTNSSGDPTDISSYSNNGSFSSVDINSSGYWGDAIEINANGDLVNISDSSSIQDVFDDAGGTLSAWVYANSDGSGTAFGRIIGKAQWELFVQNEQSSQVQLRFYHNFDTGVSQWDTASQNVTLNEWTHVVLVYDDDSPENNASVYINGVEVTTVKSSTGSGSRISDSGDNLYLANRASANRGFDGTLDEFLIFNRSLSAGEINALYNATATQYENNFTSLVDGTYTFIGHAVDRVANRNSVTRSVSIDSSVPAVTINFPANTSYSSLPLDFNVTLSENGTVIYSLDGGVNNVSMTGDQDPFGTDFTNSNGSLASGQYIFSVYANDTFGNTNLTESVVFIFDNSAPTIDFVAPTETSGSFISTTSIDVNVTAVDITLENITIRLYDSSHSEIELNVSVVSPFNLTYIVSSDGIYYFNATAVDSLNNLNHTETRNVTVDTTFPIFSNFQLYPSNGTSYSSGQFYEFNVTVTDTNLQTVWIEWENANFTDEIYGTYQFNRSDLGAGTYNYTWWANDSAGNTNSSGVRYYTIVKAASNITTHVNGSRSAMILEQYTIIDLNVTLVTGTGDIDLSLDGSIINVGTSPLYNSTNFSQSPQTITVNGSYDGNENFTSVSESWDVIVTLPVSPDETAPNLTINFPGNITYGTSNLSLNFNVTLSENGSITYSLDGGVNNVSMLGDQDPFGTDFNYTNSSIADGSYVFQVYANDTTGNNNNSESVTFSFDGTPPEVNITSPENITYTAIPIYFNITTNEIATANYSLDNGLNNITLEANASSTGFNSTNGSIADGVYTASYYVSDIYGNWNLTENVTFTVSVSTDSATLPQCSDGIDNDDDGNIDLDDSGCENAEDDDESDKGIPSSQPRLRAEFCDEAYSADSDGSGTVNSADLSVVFSQWGSCEGASHDCSADIVPAGGDGFVNVADLLVVLGHWGDIPEACLDRVIIPPVDEEVYESPPLLEGEDIIDLEDLIDGIVSSPEYIRCRAVGECIPVTLISKTSFVDDERFKELAENNEYAQERVCVDEVTYDRTGVLHARYTDYVGCDPDNPSVFLAALSEEPYICGNGILELGEQCDDGNLEEGDGCDSLCAVEYDNKIAFVTSFDVIDSNFIDLSDADTICNGAASDAEIEGEFVAWLSNAGVDAEERILDARYVRVDGELIAESRDDLIDGLLENPIDVDQNGVSIGDVPVLTGTGGDGKAAFSCNNWDGVFLGSEVLGDVGQSGRTDEGWTDSLSYLVNVQDLTALLGSWGVCEDSLNCPADIAPIPKDGKVGVTDLLALLAGWGTCEQPLDCPGNIIQTSCTDYTSGYHLYCFEVDKPVFLQPPRGSGGDINRIITVLDEESKKPLANIGYAPEGLDINFRDSNPSYPAYCSNGVFDELHEERVDCGGDCSSCKIEKVSYLWMISWGVLLLLIIWFLYLSRKKKKVKRRK